MPGTFDHGQFQHSIMPVDGGDGEIEKKLRALEEELACMRNRTVEMLDEVSPTCPAPTASVLTPPRSGVMSTSSGPNVVHANFDAEFGSSWRSTQSRDLDPPGSLSKGLGSADQKPLDSTQEFYPISTNLLNDVLPPRKRCDHLSKHIVRSWMSDARKSVDLLESSNGISNLTNDVLANADLQLDRSDDVKRASTPHNSKTSGDNGNDHELLLKEVHDLRAACTKSTEAVEQLQYSLRVSHTENKSLLAAKEKESTERYAAEQRIIELERNVDDSAGRKIESLQAQLVVEARSANSERTMRVEAERKLKEMEISAQQSADERQSLREQLAKSRSSVGDIEKRLVKSQSSTQNRIEQIEQQCRARITNLETELDTVNTDLRKVRKEYRTLQSDHEALAQRLQHSQQISDNLTADLSESRKRVHTMEARCRNLDQARSEADSRRDDAEISKSELQSDIQELQIAHQDTRLEAIDVRTQFEKIERELHQAKLNLKEAGDVSDELTHAQRRISELESFLESRERALQQARERINWFEASDKNVDTHAVSPRERSHAKSKHETPQDHSVDAEVVVSLASAVRREAALALAQKDSGPVRRSDPPFAISSEDVGPNTKISSTKANQIPRKFETPVVLNSTSIVKNKQLSSIGVSSLLGNCASDLTSVEEKRVSLEKQLMHMNMERTNVEARLNKFAPNTAGRTRAERQEKLALDQRLIELETQLSKVRKTLRDLKFE